MEKKYFKAEDYQPDGYFEGTIFQRGDIGKGKYPNSPSYREFVINTSEGRTLKFKLTNGSFTNFNKFVGQGNEVRVYYVLNANEGNGNWEGSYFLNMYAINIDLIKEPEQIEEFKEAYLNDEIDGYKPEEDNSDLPF